MERVVARLFTVTDEGVETLLVEHGPWSGFETNLEHGLAINRGEGESVEGNGQRRATWRLWDGCPRFGDFQSDAKPDELARARARIWDDHREALTESGGAIRQPRTDAATVFEAQNESARVAVEWERFARALHADALTVTAELDRVRKELQELQGSVYNVRLLRRVLPDDDGVVFVVAVADLPDGFAFDEVPGPHGEVARLSVLVPS